MGKLYKILQICKARILYTTLRSIPVALIKPGTLNSTENNANG